MQNNFLTVSVGIAAYNAEKNIGQMLEVLLEQGQAGFGLLEIIVHCDNCSDRTAEIASKYGSRVRVIDNKQRKGFAGSVKTLLEESRGEAVVLLNDDIKISDSFFLKKLIDPFGSIPNMGLVCGSPRPLPPKTFIEKAIISSFNAYFRVRANLNHGRTMHNSDGKILAVSKLFKTEILKEPDFNKMANVDTYFYLLCVEKKLGFKYAVDAVAYFRNPQTFKDYVSWFTRNNSQKPILEERFGELVTRESVLPKMKLLGSCILEGLKNPFGALFIFLTSFYIRRKVQKFEKNFSQTWEVVTTSKDIN